MKILITGGKVGDPKTSQEIQKDNRKWWTQHPMSYDWHRTLAHPEGSEEFFREIDARFFSASPFYTGQVPFKRLIPFGSLQDKRVLEIGCGLGSHLELMCRAGIPVWAIDLSDKAVELTRRRIAAHGLTAQVQQMDAEALAFSEETFDFVWSWGAIHHSSRPEQILREVHRILKPGGQFRLMVYRRRSLCGLVNLLRGAATGKWIKGWTPAQILSFYSDGFLAHFYSPVQLCEMLRTASFQVREIRVLGQTSELILLPSGCLKTFLVHHYPPALAELLLSRIGSFLFATAVKSDA